MTQPRKDPKDERREAFEQSYCDRYSTHLEYVQRKWDVVNRRYISDSIQNEWLGFQAAYAMPRVDVAGLAERKFTGSIGNYELGYNDAIDDIMTLGIGPLTFKHTAGE